MSAVKDHTNLVEDDANVKLGLLVRHRAMDYQSRLACDRLEDVLVLDCVDQHVLDSRDGALGVVGSLVETARVGVEVQREGAEFGELVHILDVILEEGLEPVLICGHHLELGDGETSREWVLWCA